MVHRRSRALFRAHVKWAAEHFACFRQSLLIEFIDARQFGDAEINYFYAFHLQLGLRWSNHDIARF